MNPTRADVSQSERIAGRGGASKSWLLVLVFAGIFASQDPIAQGADALNVKDDREAAILRAMASVQNAAERAAQDPTRPRYHFRAPGNWINDPNGPIFYKGYYHLFYQHNPYGDKWGHMHWGHARSRDLVYWEHLPIALWPSLAQGEEHCFSGCATLNDKGEPMIFYTSIGHPEPHCWIAMPEDDNLIRWKKFSGNPILTQSSPPMKYFDFRDPFVFQQEARTYMVHGGNLNAAKGGQAVVSLYEAENAALTKWKYRSLLFQHPDPKVVNIECPNFFKLGKKFVLITSPHRACDYFVGDFDAAAGKFSFEQQGMADHNGQFYAPNCLEDEQGRRIFWGWVRGFKEGRGWNGCMTLPRILSLDSDNRLRQQPAPELAKLRGERYQRSEVRLTGNSMVLPNITGDMLEIQIEFAIGTARNVGLNVRRSADGQRSVPIHFDGSTLSVASTKAPLKLAAGEKNLKLQVFLDKSVMEVFANDGRESITSVIYPDENDFGLEVFASDGEATVKSLEIWPLKAIW